jgi:hypothetical protein
MNKERFPNPDADDEIEMGGDNADDNNKRGNVVLANNYNYNFANNVYKSRDLEIDGTDYSEVVFHNLQQLNNYVYENDTGSAYATSIRLLLPKGQEVTPLDLYGIQMTVDLYQKEDDDDDEFIDIPYLNRRKDKIIERVKVIYPFQPMPNGLEISGSGDQYDGYWEGNQDDEIFIAKKRLPDGSLRDATLGIVEFDEEYCFVLKLSNELQNGNEGINIAVLKNPHPGTLVSCTVELPEGILEDQRGIGSWIKKAFKGVMSLARIVRDVAPKAGQVIGKIAGAIVSVGEKVESVAAPVVELVELVAKRTDERGIVYELGDYIIEDPKYIEYLNKKGRAIFTKSVLDDKDCSWVNSNVFDPIPQYDAEMEKDENPLLRY